MPAAVTVADARAQLGDSVEVYLDAGPSAQQAASTIVDLTGGDGLAGVSLLCVPGDAAGLERTKLKKMGWWASDTAHLRFEGCRVPARYLIGKENQGFLGIMQNFNAERMSLAAMAYGFAQRCFEEALAWSIAVNATTGRMSVSVSAHEEVVSLLGTCHAL